ncbi:MAG: hypothetical protein P0111_04640 [Nitrospira sp.]|nr:hypothetical protein [Nitrospira sp.]
MRTTNDSGTAFSLRMDNFQSEHIFKWIIVAIVMKQPVPLHWTERCDESIDGPTDCAFSGAQRSIVQSSLNGQFNGSRLKDFKSEKIFLNCIESAIRRDTLQHLAQNQVSETKPLICEIGFKPVRMGRAGSPKIVDPSLPDPVP